MNKRMKLKMNNLRLNLKKNVFNEKYFVRNTIATLVGVSAIGLSVCGANVVKDSKDAKASTVVASETEDNIEDTLTVKTISLMNPASVMDLKSAMDNDAQMVVEANDFQVVANVQDDFELKGSELEVTPSESTTELQVSEQPTTTEAPTTTQAPTTTEAPTTEAPTTEAPTPSGTPTYTTRNAFNLTEEEIKLMACVLTLECGNQCYEGQLAVANLILNRLETGTWGNTIEGVLYAQNQFSVVYTDRFAQCMANGPQESCVTAVRDAASGNNNIGTYLSYRATYSVDTSAYPDSIIIEDHIFF